MFGGGRGLRVWIRRILGPAFEAITDRFDPTIELASHIEFARASVEALSGCDGFDARLAETFERAVSERASDRAGDDSPSLLDSTRAWHRLDLEMASAAEAPDASGLDFAARTVGREDVWSDDADSAREAASTLLAGLLGGREPTAGSTAVAEGALLALPPNEWFLFKRGTFHGSSRLLSFLVRASLVQSAADHGAVSIGDGVREVLDRLIRHIEVRRGDALGFAPDSIRPSDDAWTEKLRFAIALFEASEVFEDLRYLNSAMKLVDGALPELQGRRVDPADAVAVRRFASYLTALSAQEARFAEVFAS